jgi:outer membrane murein-binding lipoprotein Lpp
MKNRIFIVVLAALVLLSLVIAGCSSAGVDQSKYDDLATQLAAAQSQLSKAQSDLAALQTAKTASDTGSKDIQTQLADAQKQVSDLQSQYEFKGLTVEQKAAQIIKNYHSIHEYEANIYDCNDMSGDVWNILKAEGISSILAIGSIDNSITDIIDSDHAWVLAQMPDGSYLALETTGGYTVTRAENPKYYKGWAFTSPDKVADYHVYVDEYNEAVNIGRMLSTEDTVILNAYNASANQAEADKWMAVHNEIGTLVTKVQAEMKTIHDKIDALVVVLK